jgi:hypothetical protein
MAPKRKTVNELNKANTKLCNANAIIEQGQAEMANRMQLLEAARKHVKFGSPVDVH